MLNKIKIEECNQYISDAIKKAKELTKENDIINEKKYFIYF